VSIWHIDELDLDAYLKRIGVTEPTLPALHTAHATTIPFENLDVFMGGVPKLDLPSIQAKMVHRGRGGYCYEQNLLYSAALERLGYEVTRIVARPRLNTPEIRPRTHMMLLVDHEGERLLTDVGWGGGGLLEPIPLRENMPVRQGTWTFRLMRDGYQWVLQTLSSGDWFELYAFTEDPQFPMDYVMANHYTASYPDSFFVGRPVLQTNSHDGRRALVGAELLHAGPEGTREKLTLTRDEILAATRDLFGIELTEEETARVRAAIPG
jgi:N-hydroxyarylamine O-acetyltransferase